MPLVDLIVELSVSKQVAQGQAAQALTLSFRIPADTVAGLTLTDSQKTKIGNRIQQMGTFLDENRSDL